MTELTTTELLKWSPLISAVSGFLGVLVGTAVVPSIRDHFSRKRDARYLAIRVVCILDRYLDDCACVALDWGTEDQEGSLQPEVSAPSTPTYPTDLDWRSIDHALMYDLLSFIVLADKAANITANAAEHAFPPDYEEYFETRNFQYATLGLKAFTLAQRLRNKYAIPDLDRSDWDPVSYLNREINKIKEIQELRFSRASVPPSQPEQDSAAAKNPNE